MTANDDDVATARVRALPDGSLALQLRLRPEEVPPGKLTCSVRAPDGYEFRHERAYLRSGRKPFVAQFAFPRDFGNEGAHRVPASGMYEAVWRWRSGGVPRRCRISFEYPPQRP